MDAAASLMDAAASLMDAAAADAVSGTRPTPVCAERRSGSRSVVAGRAAPQAVGRMGSGEGGETRPGFWKPGAARRRRGGSRARGDRGAGTRRTPWTRTFADPSRDISQNATCTRRFPAASPPAPPLRRSGAGPRRPDVSQAPQESRHRPRPQDVRRQVFKVVGEKDPRLRVAVLRSIALRHRRSAAAMASTSASSSARARAERSAPRRPPPPRRTQIRNSQIRPRPPGRTARRGSPTPASGPAGPRDPPRGGERASPAPPVRRLSPRAAARPPRAPPPRRVRGQRWTSLPGRRPCPPAGVGPQGVRREPPQERAQHRHAPRARPRRARHRAGRHEIVGDGHPQHPFQAPLAAEGVDADGKRLPGRPHVVPPDGRHVEHLARAEPSLERAGHAAAPGDPRGVAPLAGRNRRGSASSGRSPGGARPRAPLRKGPRKVVPAQGHRRVHARMVPHRPPRPRRREKDRLPPRHLRDEVVRVVKVRLAPAAGPSGPHLMVQRARLDRPLRWRRRRPAGSPSLPESPARPPCPRRTQKVQHPPERLQVGRERVEGAVHPCA